LPDRPSRRLAATIAVCLVWSFERAGWCGPHVPCAKELYGREAEDNLPPGFATLNPTLHA
jgi:hypothetical protein